MSTVESVAARDNARNPIGWFISWGVPILTIFAVNVLILQSEVKMWAVVTSFAWIGTACLANAMRCSRVHCWFTGPWCLLTAACLLGVALHTPIIGGLSFTTVANFGGASAIALWLLPELFFGKYFLARDT